MRGLTEGTKLCRASAESYSEEYFAAHGGLEAARERAVEPVSESNPVRSSDLFFAVQAIISEADGGLFAASSAEVKEKASSAVAENDKEIEMVCFAVYILDPVHEIMFHTVSQELPAKWVRWLDAPAPLTPTSSSDDAAGEPTRDADFERVPEEIREIIESGGVDPREWVSEWVEELLSLSAGVVAQRYVARRMGVGEGGIGRGKKTVATILQEGAARLLVLDSSS